uniref:NADH-ubiquinone oxidoreductase chain 2 n=1 Tax=Labidura japonica TaxID=761919 RepID=A0A1J0M4D1_9NEOP|nr:NADH dehydrogenase subunit 2 [Labidura japonica]
MMDTKKMMFGVTLILGTWISLSAETWMGAWVGLEMNLMSFIPLMINKENAFNSESGLKYFLIQAVASIILLTGMGLSGVMGNYGLGSYTLGAEFLMLMSLMLKLGVAPFHSWFPEVSSGISWSMNGILLTWQKLAPMGLMSSLFLSSSIFMNFFIMITMIVGGLGGLVQNSIKKILAYSSINHMGWMLMSLKLDINLWMMYYVIYCLLSISMVMIFDMLELNYLSQFSNIRNLELSTLLVVFMGMMSLGGLPPFMGFIPKWLVLDVMILNSEMFMSLLMVIMTLISLFYYLRLSFLLLILNNELLKSLSLTNNLSGKYNMILSLKALIISFNLFGLIFSFWFIS